MKNRKWFQVLFPLMALLLCSSALAQSVTSSSLDTILQGMSWGMNHKQVLASIEKSVMADYRKKAEGIVDLQYADRIRKLQVSRIDDMNKSYMELKGDKTATLSVSIIGEEFAPDNDESLLTIKDDVATKYYFFHKDKLYKIAVVYDTNYLGGVAFDTFVSTTEQKYGKPFSEAWDDDGNFNAAMWKDKKANVLNVKNKYASYNTFLMLFYEESANKSLEAVHIEHAKKVSAGPSVGSDIDALTQDSGGDSNSTDSILGKSTKVDLLAGLSQDEIDIINGKTTAAEVEKKKKAKAKKAAAAKKKKDKKKAAAKEGLFIY